MVSDNIMIVVGESSADLYASLFIKEFKKLNPFVSFWGTGGDKMKEEGFESLFHIKDLSIIGLFEVIFHLRRIYKIRKELINEVYKRKPKAILLVDFPDFNLSLAKKLKKSGIPIYHYISPTIWAWRYSRVKKIRKYIDKIFLIFPFEKDIYEREGVNYEFIGHPLFEIVKPEISADEIRKKVKTEGKTHIVLMPGSRRSELFFHTEAVINSIKLFKKELKENAVFSLIKAPHLDRAFFKRYEDEGVYIFEKYKYAVMSSADLIISTSGTSNFEAMILKKPVVVIYRLSNLSYILGKRFVKIREFSIVNILSGKKILPELIQENLTGENIFKEGIFFLNDREKREKLLKEYDKILSLYKTDKMKPSEKLALSIWKSIKEDK